MVSADNDPGFEGALEAAAAFICCVTNANADSEKMMHVRLMAAVRLRDGIVGNYVKARKLREVLESVLERSLAIFAEELVPRIHQRISSQIAENAEQELARILRSVRAIIESSIPTTH